MANNQRFEDHVSYYFFVFLSILLSKTLSLCTVFNAGDEDSYLHKTTDSYNFMLCNIYTLRQEKGKFIDGVLAGIFRILSADNFLVKEMVIC